MEADVKPGPERWSFASLPLMAWDIDHGGIAYQLPGRVDQQQCSLVYLSQVPPGIRLSSRVTVRYKRGRGSIE